MTKSRRFPFRFGIINEQSHSREAWVGGARKAEDLGYATYLIRDHFVPDFFGDQLAPIAALMAAAAATTRLRVGTLVFDNDYRHPVMLAKEAATLDLLSDGRLELGLGAGWLTAEYEKSEIPFDRPGVRISRMEEAIHVLKGLFADEPLTFAGDHYLISDLNGFPKPVQRPHPPLLIGGGGKRVLTLAGREANIVGVMTSAITGGTLSDDPRNRLSASVAEKVDWVRQGAGSRFADVELSHIITLIVTDDRRRQTDELIHQRGWNGITVEQVWDMPSIFIGSVDQIADDMHARRETLSFSYLVVTDSNIDACAPIVARLAGN